MIEYLLTATLSMSKPSLNELLISEPYPINVEQVSVKNAPRYKCTKPKATLLSELNKTEPSFLCSGFSVTLSSDTADTVISHINSGSGNSVTIAGSNANFNLTVVGSSVEIEVY